MTASRGAVGHVPLSRILVRCRTHARSYTLQRRLPLHFDIRHAADFNCAGSGDGFHAEPGLILILGCRRIATHACLFGDPSPELSVSLEVLHCPLVLFGLLESRKCSQIAALASLRAFLSRIQTKLSGFEFANHMLWRLVAALEHLQQHQNYNDQQNQAKASAGVRPPTAAVRPCRNRTD